MRITTLSLALLAASGPALADELNIYSQRQPELIQPVIDAFTAETGITVNIAHLDKGLTERLAAEGARSPADIILTVDISRLAEAVEAGVTQPVQSDALDSTIPAALRDPGDHWFGVTTRARVVYASRDRVADGAVTTYEDLADPKWRGRICTRSGTHSYNLALMAAMIHHHGADGRKGLGRGRKGQPGAQAAGQRPRAGQVDLGRRMRHHAWATPITWA